MEPLPPLSSPPDQCESVGTGTPAEQVVTAFTVEITDGGRSGGITYREADGGEYATWWEFAGSSGVLAFIQVPPPPHWDRKLPWAAGRRQQILERISQEVVRQKASGRSYEIGDEFINIL